MGKLSKDRRDIYYRKAKENGYRARSSFKLIQINEKFGLLKLFHPKWYLYNSSNEGEKKNIQDMIKIYDKNYCFKIIDLCAAPGSWSQVLKNICLFNYFQILNFLSQYKKNEKKETDYYEEDEFVKNFSLYVNYNDQLESKVEKLEKELEGEEKWKEKKLEGEEKEKWKEKKLATEERVNIPRMSKIISVDLQEMGNMKYVQIIQGDITKMSTIDHIRKYISEDFKEERTYKNLCKKKQNDIEKSKENFDCYVDIIVSDGAPDITGMNDVDEFIQSQLILSSLKVCCSILKSGGNFVSKIFRGEHTGLLIMHLNNFFEKVYICKPQSSRHKSLEAFLVCLNFSLPLTNIVGLSDNQKKRSLAIGIDPPSQEQLRKIHARSIAEKDCYKKRVTKREDVKMDEHQKEIDIKDVEDIEDTQAAEDMVVEENLKDEHEIKNGTDHMDVFSFYYSDSDEEIKYFNSEDEEIVNNYIASQTFNDDKLLSFVATQNYYDSDRSYLLPTNYVRCEPQLMPVKPPYLLSLQKKRKGIKKR